MAVEHARVLPALPAARRGRRARPRRPRRPRGRRRLARRRRRRVRAALPADAAEARRGRRPADGALPRGRADVALLRRRLQRVAVPAPRGRRRSCSPSGAASGARARPPASPSSPARPGSRCCRRSSSSRGGRRDRRRALARRRASRHSSSSLYPLALALWIGRPLAFLDAQKVVWERRLSPAGPLGGVVAAVQHRELLDLAVAIALIALGIVAWRRIGAAYGALRARSVALPLSFVSDKIAALVDAALRGRRLPRFHGARDARARPPRRRCDRRDDPRRVARGRMWSDGRCGTGSRETAISSDGADRDRRPAPPLRQPGRLVAWVVFVGALAALAYAGRVAGGEPPDDVLYLWSTFVGALVQYAIMLVLAWLIARGLGRDLLALRGLRSGAAARAGGFSPRRDLVATAILSQFLEAGKEQGLVPDGWDSSRAAPFVANSASSCWWRRSSRSCSSAASGSGCCRPSSGPGPQSSSSGSHSGSPTASSMGFPC